MEVPFFSFLSSFLPSFLHFFLSFFLSFFSSFFLCSEHFVKRYLKNGSSSHRRFITKLMLITPQSFTTTQRLHSYIVQIHKTVFNSGSLCQLAVCCVGRHFLMLYACAHAVLFPNQRPQSLVWERDYCTREIAS